MEERRIPSFAHDFPADPELAALTDAFARGDYARVRAEAPKLAASTQDEAVRQAARKLVERTRPDPLALALMGIAALLLFAMTAYWVTHGHAPPATVVPHTSPAAAPAPSPTPAPART